MKKYIYSAMIVAMSAMFVSCGDSSIPVYDDEYTAVRFAGIYPDPDYGNFSEGVTLYNFSFADEPNADTYLYEIKLCLTGRAVTKDTKINYEIVKENTTAPEGTYEIVSAVIPEGEHYGAITVKLIKTVELEGEVAYTLALRLLPSEDVMTGDIRYLNSRLTWSNSLPLPTNNNHVRSYNLLIKSPVAATSTSKNYMSTNGLIAIVGALGWDDWDDETVHGVEYNNATTYGSYKYLPRYVWIYNNAAYQIHSRRLGEWLDKYEQEHGAPLLHNGGLLDGQPVTARFN